MALHDRFRPDPVLDRALDLFHSDRAAYDRLPTDVKSRASIYVDLRESYRDAVKSGAITADRGSAA